MNETKKWINKAKKDITTAEVNLDSGEYEAAAFFSHQAAEKALKAMYISKFKRLWKIHDLQQLAVSVEADETIASACGRLNPHYIATRYPTKEILSIIKAFKAGIKEEFAVDSVMLFGSAAREALKRGQHSSRGGKRGNTHMTSFSPVRRGFCNE